MATLLEAYKNRIRVAESLYGRQHNGEKMDNNRKITLAKVLDNTSKFLTEAFDSSNATQRSDLGLYKKFCLNLTNVALPNLIANDLVIVHPMSSMSGYITYIEYVAAKTKGSTQNGDLFNNPFKLADVDGASNGHTADYTSARVVEKATTDTDSNSNIFVQLAWAPVYSGDDTASQLRVLDATTGAPVTAVVDTTNSDFATGKIVFTSGVTTATEYKFAYVYDNIVIPQADLPMLKAEMKSIPLIARARRIAVYYSQIAAFQAKTDYGFDLGDQLAEKAVGQLSYEIDTEITNLLIDNAPDHSGETGSIDADLRWSKTLPVGVSKTEHYEGFTEVVEIARQKIYDATRRFAPNYMLIASNVLPVLTFIKGFTAAPAGQVNGPYFAGTLNGLKVYVTPNIDPGTFVVGVNGDDMMSSAAVYAPYLAIIPTQLLQYADGGTSQGFSTMYDLKMLNASLLVKGKVID